MKQLTIFNYNYSNKKQEIINHLEKYGIDKVYTLLDNKTYTFSMLNNIFSKEKNYKEYLREFSKELKKYIKVSNNAYDDCFNEEKYSSFSKGENCLIVYDSIKGSVGPVYCVSMLNDTLFEGGIDNE